MEIVKLPYLILVCQIYIFELVITSLFLLIIVLFKHKFNRKIVGFMGIWTFIVGLEGEHADHMTTTTAHGRYIIHFEVDGIVLGSFGHMLRLRHWDTTSLGREILRL